MCTGNVCRSPFAEVALVHLLPDGLPTKERVGVASAGTTAMSRHPIAREMHAPLTDRGWQAPQFRARQLDWEIMSNSDLVLTMTWEQRSRIIEDWPVFARRTGVLTGVPSLVVLGPPTAQTIAEWTRTLRAREVPDIPDPYRQSPEVATTAAALIEQHVRTLAGWLSPTPRLGRHRS